MGPLGNTCSSSSWCQSHFDFSSTGIPFTPRQQEYLWLASPGISFRQNCNQYSGKIIRVCLHFSLHVTPAGKQFISKSRRKMEPSSFMINQRKMYNQNVQPKFVLVPAKLVDSSRAAELDQQNLLTRPVLQSFPRKTCQGKP